MKKTIMLFLIFLFGLEICIGQPNYFEFVRKDFLRCVQQVYNDSGTGTSFIVSNSSIGDSSKRDLFLITNKHMIAKNWNYQSQSAINFFKEITVISYDDKSNPVKLKFPILDSNNNLLPTVRFHSDRFVDVVAIKIVQDKNAIPVFGAKFLSKNFIKNYSSMIDSLKMSLGEIIYSIGYPAGLKNFKTNEPIVKIGYISSDITQPFTLSFSTSGNQTVLYSGKFYLVDGLITHGNSGSPIFSSPVSWMPFHGRDNFLIGIVSSGWENTGITIIYSADYILDLIN